MTRATLFLCALAAVAVGQLPLELQVKQLETLGNVRSIASGLRMYVQDYDDVYPYPQNPNSLKVALDPYIKDRAAWKTTNPAKGAEIRFNMALAGVAGTSIERPQETVSFYESKSWPDRSTAVGYADGSAKLLNAIEWGRGARSLTLQLPRVAEPLPKNYGRGWRDERPKRKDSGR